MRRTLLDVRAAALLAAGVGVGVACAALARRAARPSAPRRVLVMRHGEKEKNVPERDNFTADLVPEAVEQLEALREFLGALVPGGFRTVLASPYLRCRRTARALAPADAVLVEPGLAESQGAKTGLRDGAGIEADPARAIRKVIGRVQAVVDAERRAPLFAAAELEAEQSKANPQCMARCRTLVRRLLGAYTRAEDYPMLLVAHGASGWGLAQAFLAQSSGHFPEYEAKLVWPMTSCVVLEEGADGWRVVGHARPVRAEGAGYECRWRRGQPEREGDPSQL